jgi:hypothetical protein
MCSLLSGRFQLFAYVFLWLISCFIIAEEWYQKGQGNLNLFHINKSHCQLLRVTFCLPSLDFLVTHYHMRITHVPGVFSCMTLVPGVWTSLLIIWLNIPAVILLKH